MIDYLKGTLAEKQPTRIVVEVSGVGYEIHIPLCSYDQLPTCNAQCKILVHDHIREDAHQLFGFVTPQERDIFRMLLSTSGIGPRLALSALSSLTVREIRLAIIQGDTTMLSSISGVGRKTAERMIVELRDRIDESDALEAIAGQSHDGSGNATIRDAALALMSLGYKQQDAHKMATRAVKNDKTASLTIEDIIKKALSG